MLKLRPSEYSLVDFSNFALLKDLKINLLYSKKKQMVQLSEATKCKSPLENFHMVSTSGLLLCSAVVNFWSGFSSLESSATLLCKTKISARKLKHTLWVYNHFKTMFLSAKSSKLGKYNKIPFKLCRHTFSFT